MIADRLRALCARCPFGLMTLVDAEAEGLNRFTVARAAREGVLERVAWGIYRDPAAPVHPLQDLALGQRYLDHFRDGVARPAMPGALSGLRALNRHGADLPLDREPRPLWAVHRDRRVRLTNAPFDHVRTCWDEVLTTTVDGVRTVDPAQGIADHTWHAGGTDVEVRTTLDRARNDLRLQVPELVERWQALSTPGADRLLSMEAEGQFEQESEGEREAWRRLFVGRGPLPDCQVVVAGGFRVDFTFISAALVIEYYGREWHRDRFIADTTRVNALKVGGNEVIVVVGPMLQEADALSAHIHRERATREALIRRGALPLPRLPQQPERRPPLRTLPRW